MSVLRRKELEDSPLADLHAIASEIGLEGFRGLRKADLISAILDAQGGERERRRRDGGRPRRRGATTTRTSPRPEWRTSPTTSPSRRQMSRSRPRRRSRRSSTSRRARRRSSPACSTSSRTAAASSARTRRASRPSDVYVAPAQIRRCELRAGDEVSGPVRPPRRNERHPSLVRVETVNGADAEPPEQRPEFSELTPVFPRERLEAPAALADVPFGKGSRVAISGTPGAGATTPAARDRGRRSPTVIQTSTFRSCSWARGPRRSPSGAPRSAGRCPAARSSGRAESSAQAAELVVERAKRHAERGGHAAILVDSLDALPPAAQRRVFGAARATEEAGSRHGHRRDRRAGRQLALGHHPHLARAGRSRRTVGVGRAVGHAAR